MIKEWKLIERDSARLLSDSVNKLMNEGWILLGTYSISVAYGEDFRLKTYSQVMVKEEV